MINIERYCNCGEPCDSGDGPSTATPAGVELVRQALDLLGHPAVVAYADIADAFTLKGEDGEPYHEMGHHGYLDLGTDITCDCVLRAIMRECGYEGGGGDPYARQCRQ
jgi:hypothetical protein